VNRRSFLKLGAGAAIAPVAAPLFIPAERLEFGVPRPIATASAGHTLREYRDAIADRLETLLGRPTPGEFIAQVRGKETVEAIASSPIMLSRLDRSWEPDMLVGHTIHVPRPLRTATGETFFLELPSRYVYPTPMNIARRAGLT
jgi:hypothetical protein